MIIAIAVWEDLAAWTTVANSVHHIVDLQPSFKVCVTEISVVVE
jgi:hypothetical protein